MRGWIIFYLFCSLNCLRINVLVICNLSRQLDRYELERQIQILKTILNWLYVEQKRIQCQTVCKNRITGDEDAREDCDVEQS